jgi:hypothetical protein
MDGTTIFSKSGSDITYASGNLTSALVDSNTTFPAGHILQVKGNRSNYSWSSVGHAQEFEITWCKVSMTVKQTGSMFRVSGLLNVDDTNSSSFGLGMGMKYAINGGSNVSAIFAPAHAQYHASGNDKYTVGVLDRLIHNDTTMTDSTSPIVPTSGLINPTAGDTVVWTMTSRFNNSNGQPYLGSGQTNALPYFNTELIIMEIAK